MIPARRPLGRILAKLQLSPLRTLAAPHLVTHGRRASTRPALSSALRYRGRSVVLGGLSIKGRRPSQPCAIKSQTVLSTSLEACAACSNAFSAYCLYSSPRACTSTSIIAISRIREPHKKRSSFSVSLRLIAVIVTGRGQLSCGEAYAGAASRSPSWAALYSARFSVVCARRYQP